MNPTFLFYSVRLNPDAFRYGFRSGHSTYLALLQLYNKISSAIDKNEFTIGIFFDLSKAFDTVSHDILFDKLQHYGIRGTALDWFKSYLYNRLQYVQYNGVCSNKTPIHCGVPQGSIVSPLLFLIYINDICNASSSSQLILFALIFYSHKDLQFLVNHVNHELIKLSSWLSANKLSINLKKTNFMIFKPKQKKYYINPKIALNNHELDLVNQASFLGVILDEHLTWKSHIAQTSRKMSKSVGIIKKASFYLHTIKSTSYVILFPCLSVYAILYSSMGFNLPIQSNPYCFTAETYV